MAIIVQYDLFESREQSEERAYSDKLKEVDETCHKLRKSFFAHRNEDKKIISDLAHRLEILEKYICQL